MKIALLPSTAGIDIIYQCRSSCACTRWVYEWLCFCAGLHTRRELTSSIPSCSPTSMLPSIWNDRNSRPCRTDISCISVVPGVASHCSTRARSEFKVMLKLLTLSGWRAVVAASTIRNRRCVSLVSFRGTPAMSTSRTGPVWAQYRKSMQTLLIDACAARLCDALGETCRLCASHTHYIM